MSEQDLKAIEEKKNEAEKKEKEKKKKERKEKRSSLYAEFKKFITRGNVVDMAVGVAVATAFTAIVSAFTKGFISPILALLTRDANLSEFKWVVREAIEDAEGNVTQGEVAILWGSFLQTIIDFLIIALVMFSIMKIAASISKRANKLKEDIINKLAEEELEKKKAEEEAAKKKAEEEAKKKAEEEAEKERIRKEELEARQAEDEKIRQSMIEQTEVLKEIKELLSNMHK